MSLDGWECGCTFSAIQTDTEMLPGSELQTTYQAYKSSLLILQKKPNRLIIRTFCDVSTVELGMTAGKMAAQVAHGALQLYAEMTQDPKCVEYVQTWIAMG